MTYSFRLARRMARFRAPTLAAIVMTLVACNETDSLNPDSSSPAGTIDQTANQPELGKTGRSDTPGRGIPFGNFAQPTEAFGGRFTGALRNESPKRLLRELAAIKSRGGRVMLFFASAPKNYRDGSGHFDMGKWQARVERFKDLDLNPYINDGTIVGHMLIDEPNDPANWNGRPVSAETVEEMAKFSKQLWPNMPTVVRAAPSYMMNNHKYLDAAWAQYLWRRGDVKSYIAKSVSDAQDRGLALVVGLNVIHGGNPTGTRMTASEVEQFGSALLSSSYPCAFLSWKYESGYVSSVGNALDKLSSQAQNRPSKSCGHS
jgi:hypothetical protein